MTLPHTFTHSLRHARRDWGCGGLGSPAPSDVVTVHAPPRTNSLAASVFNGGLVALGHLLQCAYSTWLDRLRYVEK